MQIKILLIITERENTFSRTLRKVLNTISVLQN